MNSISSEVLAGASNQNETVSAELDNSCFVSEIQDMMYGFGDSAEPLLESAQLIEEIIHQQMVSTYYRAMEVSEMRGSKVVRVEDIMFLLRNNKSKFHRIVKFLALKEMRRNVSASMDNEAVPEGDQKATFGRNSALINYLLSIDQTGEIEDLLFSAGFELAWTGRAGDRDGATAKDVLTTPLFSPLIHIDAVKHDRSMRADEMTRAMDKSSYLRFFEARKACFGSAKTGGIARFWDWISNPRGRTRAWKRKRKAEKETLSGTLGNGEVSTGEEEQPLKGNWPQPTTMALEILSYIAFEAVAQLVDFALLVRRDGIRCREDRLMPTLYFNPSFPMYQEAASSHKTDGRFRPYSRKSVVGAVPRSSADAMVKYPEPITPAEIHEAIRRFWSPCSIGPLSLFSREPAPTPTRRLLTC